MTRWRLFQVGLLVCSRAMYIGELAALATAVLWAITSLFFTIASRLIGAGSVNRLRLALAMVMIALFHWLVTGSLFPFATETWRWGILSISSVAGLVIGDGALFLAFVYIGPRLTLLVMTVVPMFSAVFSWFCFGETLGMLEQVGVLVTLVAIGWVVSEKRNTDAATQLYPPEKYTIGIVLALIGALGQTVNLVVTKYALVDGYSALSATEVRIFVALILLWVLGRLPGSPGQIDQADAQPSRGVFCHGRSDRRAVPWNLVQLCGDPEHASWDRCHHHGNSTIIVDSVVGPFL